MAKTTISQEASVENALEKLKDNMTRTIVVVDDAGMVTGVVTDGDIRRYIEEGGSSNGRISSCMETDFVWATQDASRESLIKCLDSSIRAIPVLDQERRLVDVVSRSQSADVGEHPVYVRSRAPVRVSFGGGGSDLTYYFSQEEVGAVINTTVSLYTHAILRVRADSRIIITSLDLRSSFEADSLAEIKDTDGPFGLLKALLLTIEPDTGFELSLHSDFPMNSGLGGSAAVSAAVLGCFNHLRRDRWTRHELAELAYRAERHMLGVSGGWQDQYATVFGGFNFMEFKMEQNVIHPLRIDPDILLELEESLVLFDTGLIHESGVIHDGQTQAMRNVQSRRLVQENVNICYEMRNQLLRGSLNEFGKSLDRAWQNKRGYTSAISSEMLDGIYNQAISNGALGGKLLGAGGGGFFLFYVPHNRKHGFLEYIIDSGLQVSPFKFDANGLETWSARDSSV